MTFDYRSGSNLLYGVGSREAAVPQFNWEGQVKAQKEKYPNLKR